MGWKCAFCDFENTDDTAACACCGQAPKTRLLLSAGGNEWRTVITADVTRRTYRRLYPGVEHQYIPRDEGEHPFSVVKAGNGQWYLMANPLCPIRTVLNGTPCEGGQMYPLKSGDKIAIAPPSDTSRHFAPLDVSLVSIT